MNLIDKPALASWWRQIDEWRAKDSLKFSAGHEARQHHQAAIRHPAAVRDHPGPRPGGVHHHRSRPAPDVGGAAFPLREAEPLDDLRRPGHHGLRPAGRDGRADRASGAPGDRYRRRGVDPDEHPGNGHAGAVSPAGEGVHPEQPVYGHGAAVAGTAAWQPLLGDLLGGAARFRQAGGRVPCHRHAGAVGRCSWMTSSTRCWIARPR